ncbi:hypothetical protein [Devosia sp.]|uniref:hypothetical protein n=1 Tax=Devosia sp. TaxID=1871048 RepID=UPI002FC65CE2
MTFTLDTSGAVEIPGSGGQVRRGWLWSDLSPFAQGYVEALLRDAPAVGPQSDLRFPGFSDLSPEAVAMILADCAHDEKVGRQLNLAGNPEDRTSRKAGRGFWRERQTGNLFDAPPQTVFLTDDGKVKLKVANLSPTTRSPRQSEEGEG